jgi:hypothetical protein
VLLSAIAPKLRELGVETVGVVATVPARARPYFRLRPARIPLGADADLATHGAYGLPRVPLSPEGVAVAQAAATRLLGQLGQAAPAGNPLEALDQAVPGYERTAADGADLERHQAQFTGQFLIDPAGIVRWAAVECAQDGPAGFGEMPSEEELLAAARAL